MAATVRASICTSTGPTSTNAESSGDKFNREATRSGTTPFLKPSSNSPHFPPVRARGLRGERTAEAAPQNRTSPP